jgi:hypothetical protein
MVHCQDEVNMLVALAGLVTAEAREPGDPNDTWLIGVSLVHTPGASGAWGAELGATKLFVVGDHCTLWERACDRGLWWPTAGPHAAVTWRGGTRVAALLEGVGGIGAVHMHQIGYFPVFRAEAVAGGRVELGSAPALTVGGQLARSLSYSDLERYDAGGVTIVTATHTYGAEELSVVGGVRLPWSGSWGAPRWSAGLELGQGTADYL